MPCLKHHTKQGRLTYHPFCLWPAFPPAFLPPYLPFLLPTCVCVWLRHSHPHYRWWCSLDGTVKELSPCQYFYPLMRPKQTIPTITEASMSDNAVGRNINREDANGSLWVSLVLENANKRQEYDLKSLLELCASTQSFLFLPNLQPNFSPIMKKTNELAACWKSLLAYRFLLEK